MLDEDFCTNLEYAMTRAFAISTDNSVRGFWCDGVLLPLSEQEISKKNVNDKRQVNMTAFIGQDGQEEYDLILKFGKETLSRYARGLDIRECIPDITTANWYEIDTMNKKITIYLQ